MEDQMQRRGRLALIGAVAGLSLWLLGQLGLRGDLPDRVIFFLSALAVVFFGGTLAMAGPLTLRRAMAGAAPLAAAVAMLLLLASLRYAGVAEFQFAALSFVAAFVLSALALPFLIVAAGPGWRNYAALFTESWLIVVRVMLGWLFAGLIWGLIWLADALLGLVGLGVLDWLMAEGGPLPGIVTGVALGVGIAVATENVDLLSPDLVLRLLRLLALPLLIVMAVFLVALPVQGLSALPEGISATVTLLVLAAGAVTLISAVVERDDATAPIGAVIPRAARVMAVLLPLPVALAGWALWLRVDQHGWTPGRLFGALLVVLAAGYALLYLRAALSGARWRHQVRRANVAMAAAGMAFAALWLTPALNAEAISTRSQMARFESGRLPVPELDLAALEAWGRPGAVALDRLATLALEPEQTALADRLAAHAAGRVESGDPAVATQQAEALLADLRQVMPLQPATATATRDMLLAAIPAMELQSWIDACRTDLPGWDRPGCVFVVADLWPDEPGEEALVLLREASGFIRYEGLGMRAGEVQRRSVAAMSGLLPDQAEGEALIAALQDAPAPVAPTPLNMLGAAGGLLLLP
ncbi:DUF4153 domain-containing protein [Paragemmobacter ruber]|uniref:DUF4153 domain-containing protein n=1 Tax=Paragemmobacter ruber TaxID=1985673 RepID=A0ABW9Y378_9RHOB|nr:DUF4153 domain-containing protein [Rhodobacter ruber]NBE06394.1 DUF4153 domain-containing protein [Rhodobacter ruber]